ncbi:hypothetical protein OSTOST_18418, partial [Ostertagia ostertagi]
MGGGSSSLRVKSRSSADLDRLKPTAEQRTPQNEEPISFVSAVFIEALIAKLPFKRKGGNRDKVKSFRDLISTWPIHDVEALYRGNSYLLHRRLAVARCSVIADFLEGKEVMEIDLAIPDGKAFTSKEIGMFITYLYTDVWSGSAEMLESLRSCLGCNQDLLTSLRNAEKMGLENGDLNIVLTSAASVGDEPPKAHPPDYSIRCDSSIVSSRSTVFRGLLNRVGEHGRIVLDETLLPRGFAPVVMHFLYTDELDFSMIPDTTISQSSLSEARAIVAGRSPHSPLHRAIQLIHIAKFFALEKLVQ